MDFGRFKSSPCIYDYDEKSYNTYNYDEIMETEDAKKIKILNKLRISDETVGDQVHIPVGRDLLYYSEKMTS